MKPSRTEAYAYALIFAVILIIIDLLCENGEFPAHKIVPAFLVFIVLIIEFDILLYKFFTSKKSTKSTQEN